MRTTHSWGLVKEFFDSEKNCPITIESGAHLSEPLKRYKIYIDGDIATFFYLKSYEPYEGGYIWLKPGNHRIVVREWDARKVGRLESNTIHFLTVGRGLIKFEVDLVDGQLFLTKID